MSLQRAWFLRRFLWAIINASICFRSSLWQACRDSAGSGVRASDASIAFGSWEVRQTNREDLNRSHLNKCPLTAGSSGVCTCLNFCMSQIRSETWWRGVGRLIVWSTRGLSSVNIRTFVSASSDADASLPLWSLTWLFPRVRIHTGDNGLAGQSRRTALYRAIHSKALKERTEILDLI